jgi:hypothetical protein
MSYSPPTRRSPTGSPGWNSSWSSTPRASRARASSGEPANSCQERAPRAIFAQINFGPHSKRIRLPVPKDRWGEILDAVGHRVETAPLDHD